MAYEFDEINFLKCAGADWWETIQKVPIKIVDQDFGMEVPISDLAESTTDEKLKEADDPSSLSIEKQDIPDTEKVLDLDSFKRKEDSVQTPSYSKVTLDKDYFEAEIFSNYFNKKDYQVRIVKGFLVVTAHRSFPKECDGTVWRKFERRYMLPHDCHVTRYGRQVHIDTFGPIDPPGTIDSLGGGIKVKVDKIWRDEPGHVSGRHPALKSPGKSSSQKSPLKSPGKSPPPKSPSLKSQGKSPQKDKEDPLRKA